MKGETAQYQAAGIPHQLQANINVIDGLVAGRAREIWSMHKHNTNHDISLATYFSNMPESGVFEN